MCTHISDGAETENTKKLTSASFHLTNQSRHLEVFPLIFRSLSLFELVPAQVYYMNACILGGKISVHTYICTSQGPRNAKGPARLHGDVDKNQGMDGKDEGEINGIAFFGSRCIKQCSTL